MMKKNNFIVNIFQNIKRSLTVSQNEPHVEQKCDRFGHLYWQVRDRRTNKSYSFGSDSEVIAWIEQRYHSA